MPYCSQKRQAFLYFLCKGTGLKGSFSLEKSDMLMADAWWPIGGLCTSLSTASMWISSGKTVFMTLCIYELGYLPEAFSISIHFYASEHTSMEGMLWIPPPSTARGTVLSIAFAMEGERSTRPQVGEGVGDVIGSKLQLLLYFYDSVGTPDHDRFVETVFDNVGVLKLNSPSLSLSLSPFLSHSLFSSCRHHNS